MGSARPPEGAHPAPHGGRSLSRAAVQRALLHPLAKPLVFAVWLLPFAWLFWAAVYLVKMVGLRKQLEVGIDHIIHLFFEHDSSQILSRRQILNEEEMNLSLGAGGGRNA